MIDQEKIEQWKFVAKKSIKNNLKDSDKSDIERLISDLNSVVMNLDDETLNELMNQIMEEENVSLDEDDMITLPSDNPKWFIQNKFDRGSARFDAYEKYLEFEEGYPSKVITSISNSMDDVLNAIGDPKLENYFSKKGLVIGDVQSGKTGNFIALMNKAADAGYNMIVVTTGTIEKLRRQTQERIERGFGGIKSGEKISGKTVQDYGNREQSLFVTNKDKDFSLKKANPIGFGSAPIIAVIKKNKRSLEDLYTWLSNNNQQDLKKYDCIDYSLLFIDDEADNATINTKTAEDPTTINKGIRAILNLFKRSSYIGFTATPFANVLIDHENKDDLFPKDFIQVLKTPSNYMGAGSIFPENGKYHDILTTNDDAEDFIPLVIPRSEKDIFTIEALPDSLEEAIKVFFLQNAIRDLRGDKKKHRSMLINVSHLNKYQKQVNDLVEDYVGSLKRNIKNYIHIENSDIEREFQELFEEKYPQIPEKFIDVKEIIYQSTIPIEVNIINNANKSFQYEDFPEGARVIAVGGFALSRGLTLEGLSVSYLYRNTMMYDTLMQMGRWFGYRPKYDDIIMLYMPKRSIDWYAQISEASEDLKNQIHLMDNQRKTPEQFGLYIKEANTDEVTLLITARNKMKDAKSQNVTIRISGDVKETTKLDYKDNKRNTKVIEEWFESFENRFNSDLFASNLSNDELKPLFGVDGYNFGLYNKLNDTVCSRVLEKFNYFDVKIMSNSKKNYPLRLGKKEIYARERSFYLYSNRQGHDIIAFGNSRLGSTNDGKYGLSKEKIEELKLIRDFKMQKDYFSKGITVEDRNPLVIIYPVIILQAGKVYKDDASTKEFLENHKKEIFWGVSLGVPELKGEDSLQYSAKINTVLQQQIIDGDQISFLSRGIEDEAEENIEQ